MKIIIKTYTNADPAVRIRDLIDIEVLVGKDEYGVI